MDWKDVCREKNGADVCDTIDACFECVMTAARQPRPRTYTQAELDAAVAAIIKTAREDRG